KVITRDNSMCGIPPQLEYYPRRGSLRSLVTLRSESLPLDFQQNLAVVCGLPCKEGVAVGAVVAELLEHHGFEEHAAVGRHYIKDSVRAKDDELALGARGGDVEAVAAQEELSFGGGVLLVGHAVGDEDDLPLLAL